MSQAYFYHVSVHPTGKPRELCRLGEATGKGGQWLGNFIVPALARVAPKAVTTEDLDKDEAAAEQPPIISATTTFEVALDDLAADEVGATFTIEEFGSVGEMQLAALGERPVAREPGDSQRQRAGVLFSLPRGSTDGVLVVQKLDGRRSAYGDVKKAVRHCVPEHLVEIHPWVDADAFYAAVEQERVLEVRALQAVDESSTFSARATGSRATRILVRQVIKPEGRGFMALDGLTRLVRDVRDKKTTTLTLGTDEYEEISVRVTLASGADRTFTIGKPDEGWPITTRLNLLRNDNDDAKGSAPAAIGAALRTALTTLA